MWDDSFLGCRVRGEGGITHRATRLSPVEKSSGNLGKKFTVLCTVA